MKVYLVQHGLSYSELEDPLKHLTDDGIFETRHVGEFLREKNVKVGSIWHSGKPRAVQTAKILSEYVDYIRMEAHKYMKPNDSTDAVYDSVMMSMEDVMIVGHMPFMQKLASHLLGGDESHDYCHITNSAVTMLEQHGQVWQIEWMVSPQLV